MGISRLWKSVRSVVAPAIGTAIGGPFGGLIGSALAGSSKVPNAVMPSPQVPASPNWGAFSAPAYPGSSGFQPVGAGLLPLAGAAGRLAPLAGGALAAGRAGVALASRVARSAAGYCRRNPSWCATVGGLAAVEAMVRSGQLPATKRRRGRGITATELRAFKRVAKFTSKYCAPVRRAMSAPALRKGR